MSEEKKELFTSVYGYEDVKKELLLIQSWIKDKELLNNPKIMIPKGVVFYGRPGCGKTLLLREFANSFNAPIFVIEGKEDNTSREITNVFAKARKEEFAIILIDEIDLMIGRNSHIERTLQQELDGVNTKGKLLVLATTNDFDDLSEALTRPGRLDKHIEIGRPDKESRIRMFNSFLNELGVDVKDIDFNHIARVSLRTSGAEIKAICNDVYLRCKTEITTDEVEKSVRRITRQDLSNEPLKFKDMRVAVHEAGHSLMALHFSNNWNFYNAVFKSSGAETEIKDVDERVDTIEKRKQNMMIGLSGYLAEEIIYGNHDVGSYSDFNKVFDLGQRFIVRTCVKGTANFMPPQTDASSCEPYITIRKRKKVERIVKRFMNKHIKITRKWLAAHKADIMTFATKMYEKGEVSYRDIDTLLPNFN